MKLTNRVRRLERKNAPVLSQEEQKRRLSVFVECETMVTGQPPTEIEIEAERQRLSQPIRQPKPEVLLRIAGEIEKNINDRP